MDKGFQPLESLEEADFTLERVRQITKESLEKRKNQKMKEVKQEILKEAKIELSSCIISGCYGIDIINYFKNLGFKIDFCTFGEWGYVISWE